MPSQTWLDNIRGLPLPRSTPIILNISPSAPLPSLVSDLPASDTLINTKLEYIESQQRESSKLHYELISLTKTSDLYVSHVKKRSESMKKLDGTLKKLSWLDDI
ncbi:hypothetical protein BABINDRAFT_160768 [Babjeviella inositovora NRRL Y-12698]|uniref:Biogenesis of lysosome-related organelles complex 1 subunit KXD1 n=1 Tax=Babjeviella inositovora NRRL Y-12698 TaxID=984486 RepID=A0A1E3QS17_9ASCO|nr:uncharacterized protein BABINDRAFT_160768 [Babjeviella inositovora NRRL Y-12698]ODQ80489.1 hypothetical protein BABINDRAFT_160768 [Babjeviella inositovora NRRL Y-12698]